jgi:arylsulfatase A-like enzyme
MKGSSALLYGGWKLIVRAEGEPELFNLAVDPYEKSNLAATELKQLAEMQRLLTEQQSKDNPHLPTDLEGQPG